MEPSCFARSRPGRGGVLFMAYGFCPKPEMCLATLRDRGAARWALYAPTHAPYNTPLYNTRLHPTISGRPPHGHGPREPPKATPTRRPSSVGEVRGMPARRGVQRGRHLFAHSCLASRRLCAAAIAAIAIARTAIASNNCSTGANIRARHPPPSGRFPRRHRPDLEPIKSRCFA